jgi:hypothetical protein
LLQPLSESLVPVVAMAFQSTDLAGYAEHWLHHFIRFIQKWICHLSGYPFRKQQFI